MTLTRQNLDDLPRGTIVRTTDLAGRTIAAVKIGDHQTTGAHTWAITGPTTVHSFQLAQRDAVLLTEAIDTTTKPEAGRGTSRSGAAHEGGGDDRAGRAEAVLSAVDAVKETGGAVEIAGVRIEPCDAYGVTASTRERDALLRSLHDGDGALARTLCRRIHRSLWPIASAPDPDQPGCANCREHIIVLRAALLGGAS